uniref:Uncharacterized protein n=1 Tax=Parastrongyloides trichosuri TaxID=131310 RepID=A0A0N4ZSK2_PARTI
MTNTSIFWKISLAFTILIISQSIFIVNLWSNRWYTAENVKGKDGLTYTLLVGLSSNCIENNQRHKPYCTTLSTNLDQFKTFGLEFSLPSNLCKLQFLNLIM